MKKIFKSTIFTLTAALFLVLTPLKAEISVVTSIKPLHSLTTYIMEGVGEPELIIDDILVDEVSGRSLSSSDIDSSFADYFFEVLTDDEISPAFVCELLNSGDEDVYKFARKDFVCPDVQQEYQIVNPYSQKDSNSCGDT